MTRRRPLAARAMRSAVRTASLPELLNTAVSADGSVRHTASAASASQRCDAPKLRPVRAVAGRPRRPAAESGRAASGHRRGRSRRSCFHHVDQMRPLAAVERDGPWQLTGSDGRGDPACKAATRARVLLERLVEARVTLAPVPREQAAVDHEIDAREVRRLADARKTATFATSPAPQTTRGDSAARSRARGARIGLVVEEVLERRRVDVARTDVFRGYPQAREPRERSAQRGQAALRRAVGGQIGVAEAEQRRCEVIEPPPRSRRRAIASRTPR